MAEGEDDRETGEKTLTEDIAVDVWRELQQAQEKTFSLGLELKLPKPEVETIHSSYSKPTTRLLHVIIAFLKQAKPKPTWKIIVEALKSPTVNLPDVANKVKATHFLCLKLEVPPVTIEYGGFIHTYNIV